MTSLELEALRYSACIATLTALLCFPWAVLAASRLGQRRGRAVWLLDALLLLPLGLSPAVVGWMAVALLAPAPGGPGGADGSASLAFWGLVLAGSGVVLPLMIRAMRPAFEAVDHQLVLTARTLGASRWDAWWSITAAHTAPMLGSALALGFAVAWGETGAAVVLVAVLQGHGASAVGHTPHTVPLAIVEAAQQGRGGAMAWRLSLAAVGVALGAMLLSEWARRRWRQRSLPPEARGMLA